MTDTGTLTGERADLLDTLAAHRFLLRNTTRGLTDEQAGARPTVSALCLGGLIKHVTRGEREWVAFILQGPTAMSSGRKEWIDWTEADHAAYQRTFDMAPDETLDGVLAAYDAVARRTAEVVADLPDLDLAHPLPRAPWFAPGASWSARRTLLHIIAETAQHAGHADIVREALDGAKSMA
jgi:uncharacterized damage-inducible protein DinB